MSSTKSSKGKTLACASRRRVSAESLSTFVYDPDRVLLTRDGHPLRTDIIHGDKFKKTDAARLAINRLAKNNEISFTLKALKKTSASLLRGNRNYSGLSGFHPLKPDPFNPFFPANTPQKSKSGKAMC